MVEENIGLAHLCARRFLGRGMEYDDLFQAGCVGLLKAVENFDTSRGVKFSTYAVPVILGEIRRLFRDGGALRVSRGLRDLSRKALEEADKLRQETGESPGVAQIAQRLGVPVEKAALALGVDPASLARAARTLIPRSFMPRLTFTGPSSRRKRRISPAILGTA